jgi:mandelate racemase
MSGYNSLKITDLKVRAVLVPLRRPVVAAIGQFDRWPLILVDIELHGGVVGSAYVAPYRAAAVGTIVAELRDLRDTLVGSGGAPFDAFERGLKALNVIGIGGVSTIAAAAVDMALWDALGKNAGLPLAVLLGGSLGAVRTYNSNGLWRHEVSTLTKEAKSLLKDGEFTAVKMRLGNEHLKDDLAAIQAVRDGIGPDIDLMVDFNQAFGLGDAIRRCHELDEHGLYWFEEPIVYNNIAGYSLLAEKIRTPIQLGENWWGSRDTYNFVHQRSAHYGMADLMRIGGVTGWLRTAGIAAGAGLQLSNHLYPEVAVHLLRVTPTAHWLEWVDWASPILLDPMQPAKGQLSTPDRPGLGFSWNEAAVSKFAINVA